MQTSLSPAIKWSGSKRSVAPLIARLFPTGPRYIEPFVGGGAMLPYRPALKAVAGDVIPELIQLWKLVQKAPKLVAEGYRTRWLRLQSEGHVTFYKIRDSFNSRRDPIDLLFLSRTCVNGLIRFNSTGEFNNSLHHTRKGIHPDRLRTILSLWNRVVHGVTFVAEDYRETLAMVGRGDVVFLDPPYVGTRGRYLRDEFDFEAFYEQLERLNKVGAIWMLTFDGEAGSRKYPAAVPRGVYKALVKVKTGHSPFARLMENRVDQVTESVYLNFQPSREALSQLAQFRAHPRGGRLAHNMQPCELFSSSYLNS